MSIKKTKFELLPKQTEAVNYLFDPTIKELCLSGSAGSSKSVGAVYSLLSYSLRYPRFRGIIARKTVTDITKSTLNTLNEVLEMQGMLPKDVYKLDSTNNVLTFKNGSEIYLISTEYKPTDPLYTRFGSLECSFLLLEEATETPLVAYQVLRTRLRYKPPSLDGLKYTFKSVLCCNPDQQSWIYDYFYLNFKKGKLKKSQKYIHSTWRDNKHLAEDYVETLSELGEPLFSRLYLGEWTSFANNLLIPTSKMLNVFKNDSIHNYVATHISVDVAHLGTDSSVVTLWSNKTILRFYKFNQLRFKDLAKEVLSIARQFDVKNHDIYSDADGLSVGFCDLIEECQPIYNNSSPLGENARKSYTNLKNQLYFKFNELIDEIEIICTADEREEIIKEFGAIEKIIKDGQKWKVTSKDDIKKKIGKSPDMADSIVYGLYKFLKDSDYGIYHIV